MRFISSAIGVEVRNSTLLDYIKNHSILKKNGNKTNSSSFYSIIFTNEEMSMGELHFTKSFEYGSLNTIPFLRIGNIFFILTTSTQHLKYFRLILNDMLNLDMEYIKLKLLPDLYEESIVIDDFTLISKNSYELIGIYKLDSKKLILKFYSNGIISFPHNDNVHQLKSILLFYLKILNRMDNDIDE